jgi:hypothetical protein
MRLKIFFIIKSFKNYFEVHLVTGKKIVARGTSAKTEVSCATMGIPMLRINRSTLVNRSFIRHIKGRKIFFEETFLKELDADTLKLVLEIKFSRKYYNLYKTAQANGAAKPAAGFIQSVFNCVTVACAYPFEPAGIRYIYIDDRQK